MNKLKNYWTNFKNHLPEEFYVYISLIYIGYILTEKTEWPKNPQPTQARPRSKATHFVKAIGY